MSTGLQESTPEHNVPGCKVSKKYSGNYYSTLQKIKGKINWHFSAPVSCSELFYVGKYIIPFCKEYLWCQFPTNTIQTETRSKYLELDI